MMNTETQEEFAADLAWGTMMDERMIQADFDDFEDDRPWDFDLDPRDFEDELPCGHWACDCII